MKKTLLKSAVVALAGIGLMAGSALATPMLTISSGSTTVTAINIVTTPDGGTAISYSGNLGSSPDIYVAASGLSHDTPAMHLTAVLGGAISEADAGQMVTYKFSDSFDQLNAGAAGWITSFGGAGGGDTTFNATINGEEIANFVGYGPDQFYGPISSGPAPYEFILTGTITSVFGGSTSFDANVAPVPEPATMLLFGTGLLGLVGVARRRKAKK